MFISLIIIQVLILNQVQFSGFANPYIYILFILLLPFNAPQYLVLLLAFLIGFSVDIFSNSLGIHSAASVFIAFIRPLVVRIISNKEEDRNEYPGLKQNKFRWFMYYTTILVFVHHFILFYLEIFTFSNFLGTFSKIILSSVLSVFIIILSQFLIFRE